MERESSWPQHKGINQMVGINLTVFTNTAEERTATRKTPLWLDDLNSGIARDTALIFLN
jgi:hypothetical protein